MDSKTAKRNRLKGKEGEREVCKMFNRAFELQDLEDEYKAKRILTESREGSFDIEIRHTPSGRKGKALPIKIQVKNVASQFGSYLLKAWREARAVTNFPTETPLGVVKVPTDGKKKKRDQWLVVMPLETYAGMLTTLLVEEDMEETK